MVYFVILKIHAISHLMNGQVSVCQYM